MKIVKQAAVPVALVAAFFLIGKPANAVTTTHVNSSISQTQLRWHHHHRWFHHRHWHWYH